MSEQCDECGEYFHSSELIGCTGCGGAQYCEECADECLSLHDFGKGYERFCDECDDADE